MSPEEGFPAPPELVQRAGTLQAVKVTYSAPPVDEVKQILRTHETNTSVAGAGGFIPAATLSHPIATERTHDSGREGVPGGRPASPALLS